MSHTAQKIMTISLENNEKKSSPIKVQNSNILHTRNLNQRMFDIFAKKRDYKQFKVFQHYYLFFLIRSYN